MIHNEEKNKSGKKEPEMAEITKLQTKTLTQLL